MSSSNLVRLALIKESLYGETPGAGNFDQARFVSEAISGSPDTAESALIRTDRQSSGQVVTGLTVGGAINTELAKEAVIDTLMESAMFSEWETPSAVAVDLTLDVTAKTLTRASGDWSATVRVGDILTLASFSNTENNTQVMVAAITSATVLSVILSPKMVDEVGSSTTYKIADYLEIGDKNSRVSLSVEKAFLDLTEKAINYRGMLVNTFNINVSYGSIATASFELLGNDYEPVDAEEDFMTDGRTINAAAATNSMNGSVDMSFVANSAAGVLGASQFCTQSVEINLNNNLTAQNCIGKIAPQDYSEGTAQISVTLSAYLADENWSLLARKLSQDPIQFGFITKNLDGFYGFYLPAIQLSFDDPSSAGQNQDVILNMSGVAKGGAGGLKALRVYRG